MPYYNKNDNKEQLKEESILRKEDGYTIFINNTETLLIDAIENDKMLDFHTFWKSEETAKSIREARGI